MTYEDKLRATLAERGLTVDAQGRLARLSGFTGPHVVSDNQIRLFNERQAAPSCRPELDWTWVAGLADVLRVLVNDGASAPWPWISMFWIRLLGIFVEIRGALADTFTVVGIDPMTYAATPTSALEWSIDTYRAIETLRALFTDDELVYLDYRRNAEGHPKQDSYAIRGKKDGSIKETRQFAVLNDRTLLISEVDAAIKKVTAMHGDPAAAAAVFAKRIAVPFGTLFRLMRRGHGR